jgi:hypothetical protein
MPGERSTFEWFPVTRFAAVILSALILLTQFFLPQVSAQNHPKAPDLLRQLTLEEKIAQLLQLPGFPVREFKQTQRCTENFGLGSEGSWVLAFWLLGS